MLWTDKLKMFIYICDAFYVLLSSGKLLNYGA